MYPQVFCSKAVVTDSSDSDTSFLSAPKFYSRKSTHSFIRTEANSGEWRLGSLKLLYGLNLGTVDLGHWESLTTEEKFWYLPIILCIGSVPDAFLSYLSLDGSLHPKDKSVRVLSYWLLLAKMLPSNLSSVGDSIPHDLETTRAFFEDWASTPPHPGDVIDSLSLCDPVFGIPETITSLKVLKIFKAKTKPILCEASFEPKRPTMRFIFKSGDDLRRDMYTESLFFVFNELWAKSKQIRAEDKPFIWLYRVFPSENNTGFVEFVEDSSTVQAFDWSKMGEWDNDKRDTFIRSAAGAFVGSYVMGVRDRHRDNMMITDDGFFLHIDFGYERKEIRKKKKKRKKEKKEKRRF
eukprot:TRINITY_DN3452_c0_g1_i2.p1 TRINITY_DN3452_c0_g1~~TRINITY_DN3452_c0_g1_i2.p1  ORF type:complete len:366 (-),score=62.60 TRINITY_DN3452_c0_g1_i2:471-1520(-)